VLHLCSRKRICTEYSVGDSTLVAYFSCLLLLLTSVAYSWLLVLLFMEVA